jgi:predicted tellurium resistance membrane protein TerC
MELESALLLFIGPGLLLATTLLANLIAVTPTVVMRALGFLLMIGHDADRRGLRRLCAERQ